MLCCYWIYIHVLYPNYSFILNYFAILVYGISCFYYGILEELAPVSDNSYGLSPPPAGDPLEWFCVVRKNMSDINLSKGLCFSSPKSVTSFQPASG